MLSSILVVYNQSLSNNQIIVHIICLLSLTANEVKESKEADKKTESGKDSSPDPDALARVRNSNCDNQLIQTLAQNSEMQDDVRIHVSLSL